MTNKITYSNGKTPKICIVGSGFSGLCAAIRLKKDLGLDTFTIFDENIDVGGTWFSNTYPGCACDIPSHLYSFSFEPNPEWTKNYSPQTEILNYLRKVAQKYQLYSKIKFESIVKSSTWDESLQKWRVIVKDKNTNQEAEELFDIVMNATGTLRVANIPPQFESFEGPMCHTAEWDPSIKLDHKIVGIVGSGASAIQIIPTIAPLVKELHVYQRKPAWILPRSEYQFPQFLKTLFAYVPFLMLIYRYFIFLSNEFMHLIFKGKNSFIARLAMKESLNHLKKQIPGNEELQKKLTPNYAFGCKRLLPNNTFYPTMNLSHIYLHSGKISNVTDDSVTVENGQATKLEVLILATGYKVHEYFGPMQIIGKNSQNILSQWKVKEPRLYYGIVSSQVPNQYFFLGPNTFLGHNTALFMIECQVNFAIRLIKEMILRDAKVVTVKQSYEEDYMQYMQSKLSTTLWGTHECGSWYLNKGGTNTTLWPKNCTSYWRETRNVDFSKFDFM